MKSHFLLLRCLPALALIASLEVSVAASPSALVDDFSNAQKNSLGIPRQFVSDTVSGGATKTEQSVSEGILTVKGQIVPPRGQPGWASSVLLLDPQGLPRDVSSFDGIRLLVKIEKGNVSISANSSEVTNFDYHSAVVAARSDGKFHEVKIPFASMKRAWSVQTPLNPKTISAVSIVAFDMQRGDFEFEVDEVSFY